MASAGEHPAPAPHIPAPGAGLTSCITPSPDMTTSASQRPSSSDCTSSRAWFCRSVGEAGWLWGQGASWQWMLPAPPRGGTHL